MSIFNIGLNFKKAGIKTKKFGQENQMMVQVKEILKKKDQGLILMTRG